jgi:hypothetical protein
MRAIQLTVLALFTTGCGGDDTTSPADTSTTTSTGSSSTAPTATAYVGTAQLTGTAYFDGAPWDAAPIRFCDRDKCRSLDADSEGFFNFTETYVDWNSLEIPGPHAATPSDPKYATAYVPLVFEDNEVRNVNLYVNELDTYADFGAGSTEIRVSAGLHITVGAADLETPSLLDDAAGVGGHHIDPTEWVPADGIDGMMVHQWYTYPWDFHAPAGLPVRVDGNELGLADGTYHLYVGSYEDFRWLDVGELTDGDGDGWYDCDGTLPLMSTIILVDTSPTTGGTTGTSTTPPTSTASGA